MEWDSLNQITFLTHNTYLIYPGRQGILSTNVHENLFLIPLLALEKFMLIDDLRADLCSLCLRILL